MTRQAKAPFAFNFGRNGRIAFAFAMVCALLAINATGASATKYFDSTYGTTSANTTVDPPTPSGTAFGGFFSTSNSGIGELDVNDPTITTDGTAQSGYVYILDRGNNRVQVFDQDRNFKWAIGRDVVAPTVNEAQALTVNATGGKFKLELDSVTTVADLDWNITAANLDTAIGTLVGGASNVTVTGTPANGTTVPVGRYAIQFSGTKAASNQNQITVQPGSEALLGSASVTTVADGQATPGAGDTSEKQSVTIGGAPTGGTFTLSLGSSGTTTTAPIDFDAEAVEVETALAALTAIGGAANVDVTGPNGGPYAVTFTGTKASVDQAQITANPAGLTPSGTVTVATTQDGASFEKCAVASQCKAGVTTAPANAALGNAGTFNVANGIAIDQATGHFFVRERNTNSRIQEFTPDGTFVRAFGWDVVSAGPGNDVVAPVNEFETCNAAAGDVCKAGATGSGAGQFGSTTDTNAVGIAVAPPGSPTAGDVYAVDPSTVANRRVLQFDVPAGPSAAVTAVGQIGDSAVFGANSDAFPRQLAVDADGILYAMFNAGGEAGSGILRYDTDEEVFLSHITGGGTGSTLGNTGNIRGIEPTVGSRLFVATNSSGGILEFDTATSPGEIDSADLVERHAVDLDIGAGTFFGSNGIGFNAATGELLLSSAGGGAAGTGLGHRVLVLDDTGVDPAPTVQLLAPTNVTANTATLQANVNPNGPTGFPTYYRFQISTSGLENDWDDVAAEQLVGATGDGSSIVLIDDSATGLQANTLHRIRVITTRKPDAGTSISPELTFLTPPAPPRAETHSTQQVSGSSAQLIGNLNPNGLATTYWFEWGADASYGNTVPVPAAQASGSLDRFVGETISGLTPGSTYHFRLCAENSLAVVPVCGTDRQFITRESIPAPEGRSYEMVTDPDKVLRHGNAGVGGADLLDFARANPAVPASDGSVVRWGLFPGATSGDAGHAFTWTGTFEDYSRTPSGWEAESVTNVAPAVGGAGASLEQAGSSSDLGTSAWFTQTPMFDNFPAQGTGSNQALKVAGDTGGPRGAGWYPWLDPAWIDTSGGLVVGGKNWTTLIDDQGDRLIGSSGNPGDQPNEQLYQISPADGGLAPQDLVPAQTSGKALFLSDASFGWRPGDLINECTGTVGNGATAIPARDDSGTAAGPPGSFNVFADFIAGSFTLNATVLGDFPSGIQPGHYLSGNAAFLPDTRVVSASPTQITIDKATQVAGSFANFNVGQETAKLADDTIATRPCGAGSPTDTRGAVLSGRRHLSSSQITAMSGNGKRVFFVSPDPDAAASTPTCSNATGPGTACPPQLFVRQYADDGTPTVRWISRAEDAVALDDITELPQQDPAAMGNGVAFEGASLDGDVVYFRTNAPLLEDDPNGGSDPLEAASSKSWDLYRYELGADNDSDPASGDPGARLTRISGGPTGTADPNTNCTLIATSGADLGGCSGQVNSGIPNGAGTAVRFMSDDGGRVYFVTTARIPGAANDVPDGGATSPTGEGDQVNADTRNLYLYDAEKTGTAAYEFVARIPFSAAQRHVDACASYSPYASGRDMAADEAANGLEQRLDVSCVHGTGSGDAIVFRTTGRLTEDDADSAADIYLYEATADRLTRISAPSAGTSPYACHRATPSSPVLSYCNADFGAINTRVAVKGEGFGLAGQRHWNIAEHADGSLKAIYFESRLPLDPAKTNGAGPLAYTKGEGYMDVYEWREGEVSLVSTGDSPNSAFYSGNSRDGSHVFFWTEERISPWEIDDADGDLYNATTATPLPDPPVSPPACDVLAGFCQAPASPPPPAGAASSAALKGAGNFVKQGERKKAGPRRCAKGKVRKGRKCVAKRTKRNANKTRRASR